MMRPIVKGSTDQSVVIRIVDSTDGTPETGVVYNTSGIDLWYRREGATKTSITEATLGQWLKKPGEAVKLDEPIASLETDKVAIEVASPVAGILTDQLVKEGDTVNVGALIAMIGDETAAAGADQITPRTESAKPVDEQKVAQDTAPAASADLTLSPAVRRLVLELGIDPTKVKGSGKDGRLTKEDVLAAAKGGAPAAPAAAPAASPAPAPAAAAIGGRREERVKMTRLRQTIAKNIRELANKVANTTTPFFRKLLGMRSGDEARIRFLRKEPRREQDRGVGALGRARRHEYGKTV